MQTRTGPFGIVLLLLSSQPKATFGNMELLLHK